MGERKGSGMIEMGEAFFERVYAQVRRVPAGSVCTYGTIAELAGYPKEMCIRDRPCCWATARWAPSPST